MSSQKDKVVGRLDITDKVKLKFCPTCENKRLKSYVYPGLTTTTLAHYSPFYDKDGRYHHHDANTLTTEYHCSNGHKWTEHTSGSCWCGWPNKKDK